MLLAELAALDPSQRREVAAALRSVAETFAEVPTAGHRLHPPDAWPHARFRLTAADRMLVYPLRFNYHGNEIIKVVFDIANNRLRRRTPPLGRRVPRLSNLAASHLSKLTGGGRRITPVAVEIP